VLGEGFKVTRFVLVAAYMLLAASAASAQSLNNSLWQNRNLSTLEIYTVAPDGTFQGEYISRHKDYPRCLGYGYPATGRIVRNRIEFRVTFSKFFAPDCSTVTTWRGYVRGRVMPTKWRLVYRDPNGKDHVWFGADYFTRAR
jgi:hypothetical protein